MLSGPQLQNDVILIFTDAEDLNPMAGADAFVNQHPWTKVVDLVLNFEAVGSTGPSITFETGPDSGYVLLELVLVARQLSASS